MKKFIAIAILALFATACTQTSHKGMMQSNAMCEKCPDCQKMMDSGMMQDKMQCPMAKDGMKSDCCKAMMKDGMTQRQTMPKQPAAPTAVSHPQHH